MLCRNEYPILEFDDNPVAKLNPTNFAGSKLDTDKLVITFFPEVIRKLLDQEAIFEDLVIPGENPVPIYRFTDDPEVLLTLGQVGCPACAGNLDLFNAMGITRVMFCGGGGVLDRNIAVGQILVVEGAIRDEGFSYQYIAPQLSGRKRNLLPSWPDLDDRCHFPGDAGSNRAAERGRRQDRGNGAGGLYRCRAVPPFQLWRTDLRRLYRCRAVPPFQLWRTDLRRR